MASHLASIIALWPWHRTSCFWTCLKTCKVERMESPSLGDWLDSITYCMESAPYGFWHMVEPPWTSFLFQTAMKSEAERQWPPCSLLLFSKRKKEEDHRAKGKRHFGEKCVAMWCRLPGPQVVGKWGWQKGIACSPYMTELQGRCHHRQPSYWHTSLAEAFSEHASLDDLRKDTAVNCQEWKDILSQQNFFLFFLKSGHPFLSVISRTGSPSSSE